jgi:hypothetical protein
MPINKVGSKGITDGSVATAEFADGVVTSAKLQDGSVTNAKLSNTTVTLSGTSVTLGSSATFNNEFVDWQSVITADGSTGTTGVAGRGYFINTTSAAHTFTLPVSATRGDTISIKDYAGTFATNNLTIARNGHNIQGVANNSTISTNRASVTLVYVDVTRGWEFVKESNVADLQALGFISATGGTVTTSGDYKIHTFTGDGCFVVSTAGLGPSIYTNVDYLVIAGGGGGGPGNSPCRSGGGGGAGGFREGKSSPVPSYTASPLVAPTGLPVSSTTYPVTVGGGGAASSSGTNSIFSTITSAGGGYGGTSNSPQAGISGGSGGGAGPKGPGTPVPSAAAGGSGNTPVVSPSQGNNGGSNPDAPSETNPSGGSGGGGAGYAGMGTFSNSRGGIGGYGVGSSISGSPLIYSGGGGGGGHDPGGIGGIFPNSVSGGNYTCGPSLGGAGNGGRPGAAGTTGSANTGGGGGGGGRGSNSGNGAGLSGGKGIVIIRYKFQ